MFLYLKIYDYSNKYVYVGYVEIVYGVLRMFNLYCKKDNLEYIFVFG